MTARSGSIWRDSTYWLLHGRLDSHAKIAGLAIILLSVIFIAPHALPDGWLFLIVLAGTIGSAALLLISQRNARKDLAKFGNAEVKAFRHIATPLSSLFCALQRQDVHLADIKNLSIETGAFSDLLSYIDGDGKLIHDYLANNAEGSVTIYGLDDPTGAIAKERLQSIAGNRLSFSNTGRKAVTHRNVITTKDDNYYLWYESHHEMRDGHHYFPHGAYLMKISPDEAIRVHEDGYKRFFESIRGSIPAILSRTDDARDVFDGMKKAIHPPKDPA